MKKFTEQVSPERLRTAAIKIITSTKDRSCLEHMVFDLLAINGFEAIGLPAYATPEEQEHAEDCIKHYFRLQ